MIENISVHKARMRMGVTLGEKILRLRPDHDIDTVIPIPDTSRDAALEIANVLGVKYREGFIKNRYVGRTFIMPGQGERVKSVRRKLNPIPLEFRNRVVLLVDDSIVRGTTSQQIVQMARDAGARKVYLASAAPPVRYPNIYGIDMPSADELVAHDRTEAQIEQLLGCDWLIYQDLADLEAAVAGPKFPGRKLRQLLLQRRIRHRHRAGLLRAHPAAALGRRQAQAPGVVSRVACKRVPMGSQPRDRERCEPHRIRSPMTSMTSLFDAARACLEADPGRQVALTHAAAAAFARGELAIDADAPPPQPIGMPGRPARPRAGVAARPVAARASAASRAARPSCMRWRTSSSTRSNLAWDAVYRFRGMPAAFYADWVQVADDEARHFAMLSARLQEIGFDYGDFAAHNGLWEMAESHRRQRPARAWRWCRACWRRAAWT